MMIIIISLQFHCLRRINFILFYLFQNHKRQKISIQSLKIQGEAIAFACIRFRFPFGHPCLLPSTLVPCPSALFYSIMDEKWKVPFHFSIFVKLYMIYSHKESRSSCWRTLRTKRGISETSQPRRKWIFILIFLRHRRRLRSGCHDSVSEHPLWVCRRHFCRKMLLLRILTLGVTWKFGILRPAIQPHLDSLFWRDKSEVANAGERIRDYF